LPWLNLNLGGFGGSTTIYHVRVENHIYLSYGVKVTGATWWVMMRIVAGVGDMVQKTADGQAQVRYSVIE
jgi:hypothetical protein